MHDRRDRSPIGSTSRASSRSCSPSRDHRVPGLGPRPSSLRDLSATLRLGSASGVPGRVGGGVVEGRVGTYGSAGPARVIPRASRPAPSSVLTFPCRSCWSCWPSRSCVGPWRAVALRSSRSAPASTLGVAHTPPAISVAAPARLRRSTDHRTHRRSPRRSRRLLPTRWPLSITPFPLLLG
jgi:hypothetical protein